MAGFLSVRARDVLFAHWPVDPAVLRRHVPDGLTVATFEGDAWLGVVALEMTGVRAGPLPNLSAPFGQVNFRTYARFDGDLGVYFFSLDAGRRVAAEAGRRVWGLPFHPARSRVDRRGETVTLRSRRQDGSARFDARYEPRGEPAPAEPGSLTASLIERHRFLVPQGDGEVAVGEIERDPWQLSAVDADIRTNTLASAAGISIDLGEPTTHYSPVFESKTGRPSVADAAASRSCGAYASPDGRAADWPATRW
jgi:hypothetical protein